MGRCPMPRQPFLKKGLDPKNFSRTSYAFKILKILKKLL